MTDISGQKYLPLLKQNDPLGQFSKTFMATSQWVSMKCYLIWKGQSTPSGRLLFRLAPLTHPTEEIEYGSSPEMWATPNTMDHLPQRSKEALKKQATTTRKGRAKPGNLREQVNPETVEAWKQAQDRAMWPTPTTQDNPQVRGMGKTIGTNRGTTLGGAVRMWPTPTTQDSKNNGQASQHERNTKPLNAEVGGSLNPQWVEWLMGYPEGWTDLED
jgi:hypothetical protein